MAQIRRSISLESNLKLLVCLLIFSLLSLQTLNAQYSVLPTSFSFTHNEGESSSKTLTIAKSGFFAISYSITEQKSSSWLSVSSSSGSIPFSPSFGSRNISVRVNTNGLSPGNYNDILIVRDLLSGVFVSRPVSLTVTAPPSPKINLAVKSTDISLYEGLLEIITYKIENIGTAPLNITRETDTDWLIINSSQNVSIPTGQTLTGSLIISTVNLATGPHTGKINFSSNDPDNPNVSFTVNLEILGQRTDIIIPPVTTTEDAPRNSLRWAIYLANNKPGHDTIILPPGNYNLSVAGASENFTRSGDLDIRDDLTIIGTSPNTTIIDAKEIDRVFHVHPGFEFNLSGVTVTGGKLSVNKYDPGDARAALSGGGIYSHFGILELNNCIVTGNSVVANINANEKYHAVGGGGIFGNLGKITLNNCTVSANTVTGNDNIYNSGGGIYYIEPNLTISDSEIIDNQVVGSTDSYNNGGGISLWNAAPETYYYNERNINFTDTLISGNSVTGDNALQNAGGGIYIDGYQTNLNHCNISGNTVTGNGSSTKNSGGGLNNYASYITSNVTIDKCNIFQNNVSGSLANNDGGGINNYSRSEVGLGNQVATINLTNSAIYNNQIAGGNGAGIHNSAQAPEANENPNILIKEKSTAATTMTNSTISGNEISGNNGNGGGIYNSNDGTNSFANTSITNCTVTSNKAINGGGANNVVTSETDASSAIIPKNSIFSGNVSSQSGNDISGNISSKGFNIIGNSFGGSGYINTDQLDVDPILKMISASGRNGTLSHPIEPGSPAIDTGDNFEAPLTDQRGFVRPEDGNNDSIFVVDIGAFEYFPATHISGFAFLDSNGNNIKDEEESGISNISVYLDLNNDGKRDFDDPISKTNTNGKYTFADLPAPETYNVRVMLHVGYIMQSPGPNGHYSINAKPNHIIDNRNFGFIQNFKQALTVENLQEKVYFGSTIAVSGNRVAVGLINNNDFTSEVHVYKRTSPGSDNWVLEDKWAIPFHSVISEEIIFSNVDIYGDTIVVGAPNDDEGGTDAGAAYIYSRKLDGTDKWELIEKLLPADKQPTAEFGLSAAIQGNSVVVGAWKADNKRGAVYVFEKSDKTGIWQQVKKLSPNEQPENQRIGTSVAIDKTRVLAGAPFSSSSQGAIYVFERSTMSSTDWAQTSKLEVENISGSRFFGDDVSISGNTIVSGLQIQRGGIFNDSRTHAFVFEWNLDGDNQWKEVTQLKLQDVDVFTDYNSPVVIKNDTIAVGGRGFNLFTENPQFDGDSTKILFGAVFLYGRNVGGPNNWGLTEIISPDKAIEQGLGFAGDLDLDNDSLIVSDQLAHKENAVHVFTGINGLSIGKVRFTSNNFSVNENSSSVQISVERIDGSHGELSVNFSTIEDSAKNNVDYSPLTNFTLKWINNDNAIKTINIPIINDSDQNGDVSFKVALSEIEGNLTPLISEPNMATVTIIDEDKTNQPLVFFDFRTLTVGEEVGDVEIVALLSKASGSTVKVDFNSTTGTATPESDFIPVSGTLEFLPGKIESSFKLKLRDDLIEETIETVFINLSNPQNALLGSPSELTVNILSNESLGGFLRFTEKEYFIGESEISVTLFIERINGSNGKIELQYNTIDVTANAGSDFNLSTGIVVFDNGDTVSKKIEIPILDDNFGEGTESFGVNLNLSINSLGGALTSPSIATVFIIDNEEESDTLTESLVDIVPPDNQPTTGTLIVNLQPIDATGAQWRFTGERQWSSQSGERVIIPEGNYSIEFKPLPNWTPPNETIAVVRSAETTVMDGNEVTYSQNTAPLTAWVTVEIIPQLAKDEGAQWRFAGEQEWRNQTTVSSLAEGLYTIEFKFVEGWQTPFSRNIRLFNQQGSSAKGVYSLRSNNLTGDPVTPLSFAQSAMGAPYYFNGQIQTEFGEGSGFVVRERVVLTAAHVIFDPEALVIASNVRWLFQKQRGAFEPKPLVPRGSEILDGYASQRKLDSENTDLDINSSTLETLNLDAAALFFVEPAGRNGYGGYLRSKTVEDRWLKSSGKKMIVGYPTDADFIANDNRGKMFGTQPKGETTFSRFAGNADNNGRSNWVFRTNDLQTYAGNSGGPVYVEVDNKNSKIFLPAGIILARNQQVLVRAIDQQIIKKVIDAELRVEALNKTILNSGAILTGNQFDIGTFNLSGVRFDSASRTVPEGGEIIELVAQLINPPKGDVQVRYETREITAVSGEDYENKSGTLTFSNGETLQSISIPIINDSIADDGEQFQVRLLAPEINQQGLILLTPSETKITIDESSDIDIWKIENFTANEINDNSIVNDLADPDEDGIPTLLEYALDTSPKLAGFELPLTVSIVKNMLDGKNYTHLSYRRRRGGKVSNDVNYEINNVTYNLEMSSDLTNWQSAINMLEPMGLPEPSNNGTSERAEYRRISPTDNNPEFFRLKILR